jgi:hypothetical protein
VKPSSGHGADKRWTRKIYEKKEKDKRIEQEEEEKMVLLECTSDSDIKKTATVLSTSGSVERLNVHM